ncbi:hypothetical protein D3C87_1264900 [compost metagenome]
MLASLDNNFLESLDPTKFQNLVKIPNTILTEATQRMNSRFEDWRRVLRDGVGL